MSLMIITSRVNTVVYVNKCLICFFFFSSRRRHTRYWRDWSSDVCSSDLRSDPDDFDDQRVARLGAADGNRAADLVDRVEVERGQDVGGRGPGDLAVGDLRRSEERRGGKECRSRGAPYH